MKFRRFTPAGIAAARDYLAKAKAAAALDLPARDAPVTYSLIPTPYSLIPCEYGII